ncbi:MAG: hypothetical protein ACI4RG_05530 [Huintestinicola sp.]
MKKRPPVAYFIAVCAALVCFSNPGFIISIYAVNIFNADTINAAIALSMLIYMAVCYLTARKLTAAKKIKVPEKPWAVYLPAFVPFVTGLIINFFPKETSDIPFAIFSTWQMNLFAVLNLFQACLADLGTAYFLR